MNGNCHFLFGMTVGSMVALNLHKIETIFPNITSSTATGLLFVFGGILGGIFPDIDAPTSHIGQLSAPVSTAIGKINGIIMKNKRNHRGILHDPIIYIIGLYLSYMYVPPLTGLFLGCLSHLFLDMFTLSGIPFLFGVGHFTFGRMKSGSKISVVFTWICIVVTLFLGISCNQL